MNSILITGGRVIDPASGLDAAGDVLIRDGAIKEVGTELPGADEVIDATGLIVTPGLIDMHVHLREPGMEEEETIASGAEAAAAGGFAAIAAMPNTEPAVDNEAAAAFVILQGRRAGRARVFPIGAVTHGREGGRLSEMGGLVRGGAVAFSDDGDAVHSAELLRRGLLYAKMFDKVIIEHCEDRDLAAGGVMHEGVVSMRLGLSGVPRASEEILVSRDITLAELTGGRLHVAHLSAANSVELVRRAKERGIRVTCEVTPHHFTLTDACVATFNSDFKMRPPLRTEADIAALREGLADGTIDAIVSDHAPHTREEKDVVFSYAPDGVIGMETVLPMVITELVEGGVLSIREALRKMTINPARILGLPYGTLAPGAPADVTVIDAESRWKIDAGKFRSKSRNCPFHDREVVGRAVCTIVGGKVVYRADKN